VLVAYTVAEMVLTAWGGFCLQKFEGLQKSPKACT
jgi:hypothetical protein